MADPPRRGRPSAPTLIVPPPLPPVDLPNLDINIRQLAAVTSSVFDCMRWLAEHCLITNTFSCQACDQTMRLQKREGRDYIHGCVWCCPGCQRRNSITIRLNSFFEGSHLQLLQILDVVYWWCRNLRQVHVMQETGVSKKTVIDWQNYIRDICAQYVIDHHVQLGGRNRTVEIDESKFMHRKYNRGRFRQGQWVLGMIERETDNCCLKPVDDRSACTLLPIIQQHVLPGTRIVTDQWAAYNALPNHASGNHLLHFVDPNNDTVHTNQIEGCWAHAKSKFRAMHGSSDDLFLTYIQEFMWRKQHKTNIFGNMLYWISFYYQF
ncbi:hypothetical protein PoB_006487400 [Plakobranchus ocellatus]|uniref:ISXO2-like transposase domain-containing protein n=1 Tax=Plakobranchus ocellatus TaxID=259542 RepID=A0AAV4D2G9_9GAST|nr:hypothetical protein PoB_006487400 [Plakobranchus ocellatus]